MIYNSSFGSCYNFAMQMQVPFYGQHWDLDEWHKLGYVSREDAAYWMQSCCGILCSKMAMDSFRLSRKEPLTPSVKKLIALGLARGAYSDSAGWSHQGLVGLLESFDYKARAAHFTVQELREALENRQLPIISIKWAFKNNKSLKEKILFWKKYGGHLAVVVGFEEQGGELRGFYVHHTSKIKEQNWENRLVPLEEFKKGFTGRAIIVSSGS